MRIYLNFNLNKMFGIYSYFQLLSNTISKEVISDLPVEMIEVIFLYLTPQSIISMRKVSKKYLSISVSDHIWKYHFNTIFSNKSKPGQYEILFKKYYRESRKLSIPRDKFYWGIKHNCFPFVVNLFSKHSQNTLKWSPQNKVSSHIYKAVLHGVNEIINFLLVNGYSNANDTLEGDSSPLYLACQENHLEIVKTLIKNGANIEFSFREGFTPLYVACQTGNLDIIKYLIEHGAYINSQCINGSTPLYIASQEGKTEVVELLLTSGANKSLFFKKGFTPLYVASRNGHDKTVLKLIEDGYNVDITDDDGATSIYVASQNGHHEVVKLLIDNGANPEVGFLGGYSSLYVASQNGHDKVVIELIKSPITRINHCAPNGSHPLYIACQNGCTEVVRILLEHDTNCNTNMSNGYFPLYVAVYKGFYDIVDLLLTKSNIDINFCSHDQHSVLWIACIDNKLDIAKLLISKGAMASSIISNNTTILHVVIDLEYDDIVLLLATTFPHLLFEKDHNDATPLQLAYKNKNKKIIEILETYLKSIISLEEKFV
jgi:serine/threonine-protein phosphatase 6 regulatory ankyrin repeat subunit B